MAESDEEALDLFQEPDDYYQKEKAPTQVQHQTLNGEILTLRLVGQNPLWVGEGILHYTLLSAFEKTQDHELRTAGECTAGSSEAEALISSA